MLVMRYADWAFLRVREGVLRLGNLSRCRYEKSPEAKMQWREEEEMEYVSTYR